MLSQENNNKYNVATFAFYNVENIFDTINSVDLLNKKTQTIETISLNKAILEGADFTKNRIFNQTHNQNLYLKLINNEEFTPKGPRLWNKARYEKKIEKISYVISNIGKELFHSPPVIVGLSEIENETVLKDLLNSQLLGNYKYNYVHFNSLDSRGIDCALIYQSSRFKLIESKNYRVELIKDQIKEYSRDILFVSGLLDGEKISVFVNHWPSRRSGEKLSEAYRIKTATILATKIKELKEKNAEEKIVIMGDFNDNPTNKSIKMLNSKPLKENLANEDFYNPMEVLFKKGFGTAAYMDSWFLFDQFLVSASLVNEKNMGLYHYHNAGIFDKEFLKTPKGKYKGYPRRSFNGIIFDEDGFSDHFPVYLNLKRRINN
ncbi:MAG: hypothetical protein ACEQSF_03775 [Solirubrobacteraceae bacterium]